MVSVCLGCVACCSEDYGKTLTRMDVPHNASIETLTAGMVGLWVAIHIVNPNDDQHEVQPAWRYEICEFCEF